jgi:hypothetical protein
MPPPGAREWGKRMKVTVEVDCTPLEARQFLGLPDVQPMQTAIMGEMERKMLAEMDRFSPEGVLKTWLALIPQSPERLQEMFAKLFGQSTRRNQP